jgi:hypothetical protein
MSSRANESSYGVYALGHAVFTYYLVEALGRFDQLDKNKDYALSAEEIGLYAQEKTPEYMNERFEENQDPVISDNYYGELAMLVKFVFASPVLHRPSG